MGFNPTKVGLDVGDGFGGFDVNGGGFKAVLGFDVDDVDGFNADDGVTGFNDGKPVRVNIWGGVLTECDF